MQMELDKLDEFRFHRDGLVDIAVRLVNDRCQIIDTGRQVRAGADIKYQKLDRYQNLEFAQQPFADQGNDEPHRRTDVDG